MLSVLLAVTLLQAPAGPPGPPTVVVVVSRRVAVSKELADGVARQVEDALKRAGVGEVAPFEQTSKQLTAAGVFDSSTCQARRACLAKLGVKLGAAVVVGVDVGTVKPDIAVGLEAVAANDGRRLAQRSFLVPASNARQAAVPEIVPFATATKKALPRPPEPEPTLPVAPPPPPVVADAPKVEPPPPAVEVRRVEVLPAPREQPIEVATEPAPAPSRTGSYVAAGGAIGAAGAALAFTVMGLGEQGRLPTTPEAAATMTRSQADAYAARANADFTLGLSAAITAAALTSLAVYWWPGEQQ